MTLLRAELPKRFPGIEFFFQPGRHRHADPQLRPAGGDRRAVHRAEPRQQLRARRRADQEDPADPRRGRRARAPAHGRAGDRPADGPHAPAAGGPVGVQRRAERAALALGQLADRARVLAQPAERRRLQHRGAGAAVQRRLARFAAQHAGGGDRRRRRPTRRRSCSATWSRRARAGSCRSSRATTSRPRSMSTSACRAPTSPASPAR